MLFELAIRCQLNSIAASAQLRKHDRGLPAKRPARVPAKGALPRSTGPNILWGGEVVCVKFSKMVIMLACWVNRGGAKLASLKLVCAAGRTSCSHRHRGPHWFDLFTQQVRIQIAAAFHPLFVLLCGHGPSPANKALSVAFRMNGKEVAWSPNLDRSIPAGGMALVCGSDGPAGSGHCAVETATFSIQVEVDNRQLISETIESNNLSTGTIH
jgi:hypothetical protein